MNATSTILKNHSSSDANPYYLQHVLELSNGNAVFSTEDIYDKRGMKILKKGAYIDQEIYERLLRFKILKPVESVLSVENAVTVSELVQLADEIISANTAVATALSSINAENVAVRLLREMRLDSSSGLMLSMQKASGGRLRHGMVVALLSAGLGHQARLPPMQMSALLAAAILHDVGEFYISPAIFTKTDPLTHGEWRQVVSHPLIGATAIRSTMHFPAETSHYVLEHHERLSGYGYPRQVSGSQLSTAGAFLGVAEVAAAILSEEKVDLERMGNVLKLIPGEFPPFAVSIMDSAYRAMQSVFGMSPELFKGDRIQDRASKLESALLAAEQWIEGKQVKGEITGPVSNYVRTRLAVLRMTGSSTGLFGYGDLPADSALDSRITAEQSSVCEELWHRFREIPYLADLMQHTKRIGDETRNCNFSEFLTTCGVPHPMPG